MTDASEDKTWKQSLGFPINYDSNQSSDEDSDAKNVVVRNSSASSARYMLHDVGDGAEADLLGTTPPRARIRVKQIWKSLMDARDHFPRIGDHGKRTSQYENAVKDQNSSPARKRGFKNIRTKHETSRKHERDLKQDMTWENRVDSLPSPNPGPEIPTLVESCNQFLSLTSRLKKCRDMCKDKSSEEVVERRCTGGGEPPDSRVNFHKTFSMLINMGNIDKGCRRMISREEQVWQNELKDLIWLELQAKIAGRTPPQQDAYLCAQRNIVPTIVQNIIDYRFVNPNPCKGGQRLCVIEGSTEDLTDDVLNRKEDSAEETDNAEYDLVFGCLSFSCERCNGAIGKALKEVGTLLDSFYNAVTLYPSSKAMTVEHPLIATQLFKNRLKAMCLWYNVAAHLRVKVVMVRRMLRSLRVKALRRGQSTGSTASMTTPTPTSRQSSESTKPCQVRFNVDNPSDSNNSDSSSQSELQKDLDKDSDCNPDSDARDVSSDDCVEKKDKSELATPEIVISDNKYGTNDTTTSMESGYTSANDRIGDEDLYEPGSLEELTRLRLLEKCDVSPYRAYHTDVLKTQGVRRSMMFINKMRSNTLRKAFLTLNKLDIEEPKLYTQEIAVEVFADTKTDEDKTETVVDNDAKEAEVYELRRYGCWSEESLAMRLPSYRNHFLLLNSICMEAVHDYLSLRLEGRPEQPSCLTVKQLIHELKEGLDIATEMRATFAMAVAAAVRGTRAGRTTAAWTDLQLLVKTFDSTIETVFKQYLSYLTTMSLTEHMPRSCLETEWAFTARLAKRVKCAALLAPVAFTDISCNQLHRIQKQFEAKLDQLKDIEVENQESPEYARHAIYNICRGAQNVYASEREATFQCAQWARALAVRLRRAHSRQHHHHRLRERLFNRLMSIRDCIVRHTAYIQDRSKSTEDLSQELSEQVAGRVRELLLHVYKWAFEIHKELHRFATVTPSVGPSCLRRSVSILRPRFLRTDSIGEDGEIEKFDHLPDGQVQSSIERLLTDGTSKLVDQSDNKAPGMQEAADPTDVTEEEKQWAARVSRAIIEFARCWMQFVMERCDRGRGLRPRWASQGLDFLMLACDPCNTKHLTDGEFEELQQLMDSCISHVIGSRPTAPRTPDVTASPVLAPRARTRHYSPAPSQNVNQDVPVPPVPPTPPSAPDPLLSFHQVDFCARRRRVIEATRKLDQSRDDKLREMKTVGHVLESTVTSYEPKLRQVTFKWQRGLKIGAGTFGKVYTVVNTETGQLLAMKELSIGAGDRRALQRAANELKVLEGVIHPHLVRYYGCEVHREEMLIFMELCVEGSLEALLAASGPLHEQQMRRYTKQLVSAVLELHTRNIAHRDIKSGNIFLTNEGHCLKLGDFGCAVKIRANTTAAGELQGCVGTQAYMAPEVFMKSSGHGRAADIWSLGCVVTEMASGKRPFSEYDSNYQIMFVVGMGGRPHIPDSLSAEGEEFCTRCLTHDPEQRPRAEELALHHFLMVNADNDCECEPAFLIANN